SQSEASQPLPTRVLPAVKTPEQPAAIEETFKVKTTEVAEPTQQTQQTQPAEPTKPRYVMPALEALKANQVNQVNPSDHRTAIERDTVDPEFGF
ncbi:MAG: hypothetical protein ACKO0Z_05740, partial [Betaproteobacteria bacterium]